MKKTVIVYLLLYIIFLRKILGTRYRALDLQGPDFSDSRDSMIIFSDSRDQNRAPKTLKKNLLYTQIQLVLNLQSTYT